MKVMLCYKNYKLGTLEFDGKTYKYTLLDDSAAFIKKYSFIKFPLANAKSERYDEMPYFFEKFVTDLVFNESMSRELDIDLEHETYFDVLCKYAKLKQDKNTFYYVLV